MKTNSNFFKGTVCIGLILTFAVIFAGCTSATTPVNPSQQSSVTPVSASQTGAQKPVSAITTSGLPAMTMASLSNGITISYPSDWKKEMVSETSLRDYGRITTNIANFYSPDITSDRANRASPNVDTSKYTTLSVDVDPTPVTDFEQYFNLVTLALQKEYGSIEITKHNYQLKISATQTFSGYKSYQMDFDTKNMRGTYIFTNVDGTIYIFAFKNPSPYSEEVHEMYDSIRIVPLQGSSEKHR
ncbi:MAG: hypothetical protein Q7T80_17850 [Methanoregula sp.]|nr:hypothetical protein [Methanoregula sp.]